MSWWNRDNEFKSIDNRLEVIEKGVVLVMANVQELEARLDDISTQLSKATQEIVQKIGEIQSADLPPEVSAKLDELKAKAQALDDIVPDQP